MLNNFLCLNFLNLLNLLFLNCCLPIMILQNTLDYIYKYYLQEIKRVVSKKYILNGLFLAALKMLCYNFSQ